MKYDSQYVMDDEGNLEWGASYDSGCLGDQEDVIVSYCHSSGVCI